MKVLVISVLLISMATGLHASFFTAIEEPSYTVGEKIGENVEIREYESTKWVGVTVQTQLDQSKQNKWKNFMKLFKYIRGGNNQGIKMEMTAPVTMTVSSMSAEKLTMKSQANMTMSFFVGKAHQANTPEPTDKPTLKIQSVSSRTVASIRFGGFTSMEKNLEKRDELIKALGDSASQYDQVNFITAGYDGPFKFRRNEIWLVKK